MSALPHEHVSPEAPGSELRLVDEPDDMDAKEIAAAAARQRAMRSLSSLHELLEHRPELRGVYVPADLAVDAIRWSA